jgi:hypothetical protein
LAFFDCWQALIYAHEDDSGHAGEKCSAHGLVHTHEAFEGLVRPKPLKVIIIITIIIIHHYHHHYHHHHA